MLIRLIIINEKEMSHRDVYTHHLSYILFRVILKLAGLCSALLIAYLHANAIHPCMDKRKGKQTKNVKRKEEKENETKKETGHTVLTRRIPQDGVDSLKFSFVLFG